MIYKHKNIVLEKDTSKGKLYINGNLRFMGDGYVAIKMFIDKSERDPNVVKIFRAQLDMREDCKYKLQDEVMKRKKEEEMMRQANQPKSISKKKK